MKTDGTNDDLDLISLLYTLWRAKFIIALFVLVAGAAGFYQAFERSVPLYNASVVVVLEEQANNIVELESVVTGVSGEQASINTELEVIRSRNLIGQLVDRHNLIEDPEFNASLREQPKYSIAAFRRLIRSSPAATPSPEVIRENTISNVRSKISATNVRQSYVFRIAATTESPRKSAMLANALAELYIEDQINVKYEATARATEWLSNRVSELRVDLETSEALAKDFAAQSELVSPEALLALDRQIKDLRERRSDLVVSITDARVLSNIGGDPDYEHIANLTEDRTLGRLLPETLAGDESAQASFEARASALAVGFEEAAVRFESQLASVNSSIELLESQQAQQSGELVELEQLQREAQAARGIYEYFLTRMKETSVQQGIQQADSRVLSPAIAPRSPSAPRKSFIIFVALILGGIVGCAFALLREMSNNSIRTAEELEDIAGINVIGQIPLIPARNRSSVLKYLTDKPNSVVAEAIRNLRTSLLLTNIDEKPQVIMSTSSLPAEGKTTQSLALSQNFSGMNQKVLLIEGDIRRRVFSEYFDISRTKGLLSVLSGEVELKDAVAFVDQLGCDVLIGEKSKTNAADVFSSKRFKEFLDKARKEYDIIIIDTPPLLLVPDARVIGQSVDAILYTVKWDQTTRMQVRQGIKMFEQVNLKVSGLVLNQIDPKGMKKYGYGADYGAYGAYGSEYYSN